MVQFLNILILLFFNYLTVVVPPDYSVPVQGTGVTGNSVARKYCRGDNINCVALINVATIFPKDILSLPGNSVVHIKHASNCDMIENSHMLLIHSDCFRTVTYRGTLPISDLLGDTRKQSQWNHFWNPSHCTIFLPVYGNLQ